MVCVCAQYVTGLDRFLFFGQHQYFSSSEFHDPFGSAPTLELGLPVNKAYTDRLVAASSPLSTEQQQPLMPLNTATTILKPGSCDS